MAQDLHGVENQLQRHEGLERELAGMEQQVSRLLARPLGSLTGPSAWPICSSCWACHAWQSFAQEVLGLITQNGNIPQDAQVLLPL